MTVKPILRMGHPILREIAKPVSEFNSAALDTLLEQMQDTMVVALGAGLAAPQIGVGLRVVIFGGQETPRYPDIDAIPYTVLINPELTVIDPTQEEDWEGCLSLPGLRGRVPRYTGIHYRGYDASGAVFERTVSGFHSRVVQHECDHLDGILYPQRIKDMRDFGYEDELQVGDCGAQEAVRE